MRVAIVGQGYVGTAIGLAASRAGHDVVGIENNVKRMKELSDFIYPVTNDYSKIEFSEIVILAVPTPLDLNREPDLSQIESACLSIKPFLDSDMLLINESTSYPGTLRNFIAPIFGKSIMFASAPERVDPGNEKWNLSNTPRVVGGLTQEATSKAISFYKTMTEEVIEVSSPEVAEAAKLFENTFRQVNIALVNEFSKITNALEIPTNETLEAAATKPYGFMKFLPSIGVGGHCIPIDPTYLSFRASQLGTEAKFIELANEINLGMPSYVADRIDKEFKIKGKRVQIAGIAYKANVPDLRESPALELIQILRKKGAQVSWHDELIMNWNGEKSSTLVAVDLGIICAGHSNVDFSAWINTNTEVIDLSLNVDRTWRKYL